MTMLRLENGCTALKAQSPLTSGAIHIKGFPYPVGKLPLRIFLLRIEVLNPKGRAYTRNGFNSCGVSRVLQPHCKTQLMERDMLSL